jgi:streptomycin 6-kinase
MADADPPALDLPPRFVHRHRRYAGWLAALPGLIQRLAERWALRVDPPFPGIEYNYVAPATRADGAPCVLKVGRPDDEERRTEAEALRLWDGNGAARLLAADPNAGALLLERLTPGTTLVGLAGRDDESATRVAAGVLRRLHRPAPAGHALRPLRAWFESFDRCRAALRRGDRGFPAAVFERADALLAEQLATAPAAVVLHGDLHHGNVLESARPGEAGPRWRAIDPKGLAGDPAFDICQFLFNPGDELPSVIARRVDVFTAELDLDRRRTTRWCFLWAILQACWDFEDGDDAGWRANLARADFLLAL